MTLKLWMYNTIVEITNKYTLTEEDHLKLVNLAERAMSDGYDHGLSYCEDFAQDEMSDLRAQIRRLADTVQRMEELR